MYEPLRSERSLVNADGGTHITELGALPLLLVEEMTALNGCGGAGAPLDSFRGRGGFPIVFYWIELGRLLKEGNGEP